MTHNLKLFFRNLNRQKTTSIVTIGGFAISLAIFIIIYTFVLNEKKCDASFPNIDNMYRIVRNSNEANMPKRTKDRILELAPEIEAVSFYTDGEILLRYNETKNHGVLLQTDRDFFTIFSVNFLHGDPEKALQTIDDMVVTKSFSLKVFGKENSIGEIIEMPDGAKKYVTAVVDDPPKFVSSTYEVIINNDNDYIGALYCSNECYKMRNMVFLVHSKTNVSVVENKLKSLLEVYPLFKENTISLQPYKEIYFDTKTRDFHEHANIKFIKLLGLVALIILILTIINYINLAIATNLDRFKEICIRKSSGAGKRSIIRQFMVESYISCGIALALAFLLIYLFAPIFTTALNFDLSPSDVFQQGHIIFLSIGITIILGSIVGYFPAKFASMFNPVELIQSKSKSYKSGWTGILNTLQFSVAIVLIVCLIVVGKQINYAKTKNLGFNTDHLVRITLEGELTKKAQSIKNDILNYSLITDASLSAGNPMDVGSWVTGNTIVDGESIYADHVGFIDVDDDFIKTFNISMIKGRNIRKTDKNVCLINETLYKTLSLKNIDNKQAFGQTIVGVFEDIHFEDLHTALGNLVIRQASDNSMPILSLRMLNTDIPATMDYVKSVLHSYDSELKPTIEFYDDIINAQYEQEEKQASAIKVFSIIAIFITCLGLYGKINLTTKNRIKEIGIRKVNGATIMELIGLLNRDIIIWIGLAYVVAAPVAYYLMEKWLSTFAYKTELSWWVFAVSGLVSLVIALVTVSVQSYRAAVRNPVEALRYE